MAVYTEVSDEALSDFLALYDSARSSPSRASPKASRTRNFLLRTDAGQFILTLYEKRVRAEDLPFFIGLMEHLAQRGVTCPQPVRNRDGEALGDLQAAPAAIVTFLDGLWIRRPNVGHCGEVGEALARMHLAGADFRLRRVNALSLERLAASVSARRRRAPTRSRRASREEMRRASSPSCRRTGRTTCPRGVIHADLFPDNVFFLGERLSGLIDFYFACNDALAYDLGDLPQRLVLRAGRRVQRIQGPGDDRGLRAACARWSDAESRGAADPGARRGAAFHADAPRRLAQRSAGREGRAKKSARISRQAALPSARASAPAITGLCVDATASRSGPTAPARAIPAPAAGARSCATGRMKRS